MLAVHCVVAVVTEAAVVAIVVVFVVLDLILERKNSFLRKTILKCLSEALPFKESGLTLLHFLLLKGLL